MINALWEGWLFVDEPLGAVLGLVIVWCFIRENLWAWPLGIAFVVVLTSSLVEARLYANLALHWGVFLPMNLYGWYYWVFGRRADEKAVPVTRSSWPLMAVAVAICAAGTAALGAAFSLWTDAALPFWDNGIFVASIVTMWLTARKKIENWIFWFVIDVVQVGVYWHQALYWYAGLYFVYLGMAVAGWLAWQRSMHAAARAESASAAAP